MSDKPRIIAGRQFVRMLGDTGIISPNTRRVVIDAAVDRALVIYTEHFGDDRILSIGVDAGLAGVEVIEQATAAPGEKRALPIRRDAK